MFNQIKSQEELQLVDRRFSDTQEIVDLIDTDEVTGEGDSVDQAKFQDVASTVADAIGVDTSVVEDLLEKKIESEGLVLSNSDSNTSLEDADKASSETFFSYIAQPAMIQRYQNLFFSNPTLLQQTPSNFANINFSTNDPVQLAVANFSAAATNANTIIGLVSEQKIRNYSIDGVCEKICRATGANFSVVESALLSACNFSVRRGKYDQMVFSIQANEMVDELAQEAGAREAAIVSQADDAIDVALAQGGAGANAQEEIDQRTTSAQDESSLVTPNAADAGIVPDAVSTAIVDGVNNKAVLSDDAGQSLGFNGINAMPTIPVDPANPAAAVSTAGAVPPPSQNGTGVTGKDMAASVNFSNANEIDAAVLVFEDMLKATQY